MEDLKLILQQQNKLIEMMMNKLSMPSAEPSVNLTSDTITNSITEFSYLPDSGLTFEAWFKRYEDLFAIDLKSWDENSKVRLLLRKLGVSEHEKYCNFILPKKPTDLNWKDTIQCLTKMFGERSSLFHTRYQCPQMVKNPNDDYVTYAGHVNRECEKFKLRELTNDQFKCLIFVCGLQAETDADIRTRILSQIEANPEITLQAVTEECQRLINLKHDTQLIEKRSDNPSVHAVHQKPKNRSKSNNVSESNGHRRPKSACWKCGEFHYAQFCPFTNKVCHKCGFKGHKQTHCRTRVTNRFKKFQPTTMKSNAILATTDRNFSTKRKFISVKLNDVPVKLQLDTASDITLISRNMWSRIGKPRISPTKRLARNVSGGQVQLAGELNCELSFNGKNFYGTIYIIENSDINLLGIDWIEKLGLWDMPLRTVCDLNSKINMLTSHSSINSQDSIQILKGKYADVFKDDIGLCTKMKAKLYANPIAKPVPYSSTDQLDREIDRLQQLGVPSPGNYSALATPIVAVKKANGILRICGDFSTGLNDALQVHQYPLPNPEHLFSKPEKIKSYTQTNPTVEIESKSKTPCKILKRGGATTALKWNQSRSKLERRRLANIDGVIRLVRVVCQDSIKSRIT